MRPKISFEFFPPKTPQAAVQLQQVADQLANLNPAYFSVTYGAIGSSQEPTFNTVFQIKQQTKIATAPHLSCISSTREQVHQMLQNYQSGGIKHLVALRGDIPDSMKSYLGEFRYAKDLVKFIREETEDHFHIEVAAYPEYHPETLNHDRSFSYFKEKIFAGANGAITQYFYNADAYLYFRDTCAKQNIHIPITPGIMPITNYQQLMRFSNLCGAEIPRWIRYRLESFGEDLDSLRLFGEEVVTHLCEKLLKEAAPGLHFYTLNKAEASMAVLENLGLILEPSLLN